MGTRAKPDPVVYEIICAANGKRYIGSTGWRAQRLSKHQNKLQNGKHENPHLQNAWRLYGSNAFVFRVVASFPDTSTLIEEEQRYLDSFKPDELFNIRLLAVDSSRGLRQSTEAKLKKSLALKGRVFSATHLEKLSKAGKRRTENGPLEMHAKEAVEKSNLSKFGRKHPPRSEAFRAHMSEVAKRRNPHPRLGATLSDDTKRKIVASNAATRLRKAQIATEMHNIN